MRTRIALAAIVPVALSSITLLSPVAASTLASGPSTQPHRSSSFNGLNPGFAYEGWSPQMVGLVQDFVSGRKAASLTAYSPTPKARPVAHPAKAKVAPAHPAVAPPAVVHPVVAVTPAVIHPVAAAPKAAAPVAVATPPTTAPTGIVDTVTPTQRAEWSRVAMCEEGGNWHVNGSRFSGGLGITRANWVAYGGLQYAPYGAAATPDEQIMVAERIQANPPDQYGCSSW